MYELELLGKLKHTNWFTPTYPRSHKPGAENGSWTYTTTTSCGKTSPPPSQTPMQSSDPLLWYPHLTDWSLLPLCSKGLHQYGLFPPSIPMSVLCHLKAHPSTWTWTVRAGTVLTVPTVPIHCKSDAPKAIKWIISIFHLFKSSLNKEHSICPDRKVSPPWCMCTKITCCCTSVCRCGCLTAPPFVPRQTHPHLQTTPQRWQPPCHQPRNSTTPCHHLYLQR